MKITLKDGSFKEYESAMAVIDIAKDISEGLARVACVAEVDGKIVDLRTTVDKDCTLNILTFDSEEGKKAYRHTCAHVMACLLYTSITTRKPSPSLALHGA